MRLNPAAFNAFLTGNIGQDVRWRSNSICPCTNPMTGAANPKCPKCGGKGRLWADGVDTVVGVSRQNISVKITQQFQWETGDAMLTVNESSAMYDAGQYDRVTLLNSTDRFSLALIRGDLRERIYSQVEKIDRVFWYTGDGGQGDLVEGSAVPEVNPANGQLTWGSGAPPAGKQYAITGTRFAEYFIYLDLPSDRAEHRGARLPKRIIARRFDLFGR